MANLKIKAPDGKTLKIRIPEGTPSSQYGQLVDEVTKDYMSKQEKPGLLSRIGTGLGQVSEAAKLTTEQIPVMGLGGKAAEGIENVFQRGGEQVTESLAGPGLALKAPILGLPPIPAPAQPGEQRLKTSPEVAAGIGTVISDFPTYVSLAGGAVQGVRSGGRSALRKLTQKPPTPVSAGEQLMQQEIKTAKQALQAEGRKKAIQKLISKRQKEIELAEKEGEIFIKDPPEQMKEALSSKKEFAVFLKRMKKLDDFTPEEIQQRLPKEQTQVIQKTLEEGLKKEALTGNMSQAEVNFIRGIREKVQDAISLDVPKVGTAKAKLGRAYRLEERLPEKIKEQRLKGRLQKAELKAQVEKEAKALEESSKKGLINKSRNLLVGALRQALLPRGLR